MATKADLAAVDLLLAESYPRLLAADYAPSVLVTALPLISRAQPGLVTSGRYFLAWEGDQLLAAGGWSMGAPGGGAATAGVGHIRHVVTDWRYQRRGIGRALMQAVLADAMGAGVARMECLSTLTAERFYASLGFVARGRVMVALRPGIDFPAMAMDLAFP
ncbi:MAG: GNAT family N-acetyltransferase [Rhodobacteraceae bacterium]|nr:GNAT family N-acetyltransferase [Paracoccaceae bacterium]